MNFIGRLLASILTAFLSVWVSQKSGELKERNRQLTDQLDKQAKADAIDAKDTSRAVAIDWLRQRAPDRKELP